MNRRLLTAFALTLLVPMLVPRDAFASNDALLKLLQVLRDRGSISASEYEDIRRIADATPTAPTIAETPEEPETPDPLPLAAPPAIRTVTFTPTDVPISGPSLPQRSRRKPPRRTCPDHRRPSPLRNGRGTSA